MVNCSVIGINGMPTLRQTTTAEFTPVFRLVNNMTGWINNLHIIGSYSGSGDGTTEYNHLINLRGVNGVTVSGNLLEKALGDCVTDNAQEQDANAARNVLVTGNTMLNPWRCNVSFNNVADRWAVMNNYMTYYTSYVNPVCFEPSDLAYVTNVEVGYNDIQSPNPKWEDANHFYDAVVKVTAYFDNTPEEMCTFITTTAIGAFRSSTKPVIRVVRLPGSTWYPPTMRKVPNLRGPAAIPLFRQPLRN